MPARRGTGRRKSRNLGGCTARVLLRGTRQRVAPSWAGDDASAGRRVAAVLWRTAASAQRHGICALRRLAPVPVPRL